MRVIDYFDKGAQRHPDRDLLVSDAGRCTYGEAQAATYRIAAGLCARGFEPGDGTAVLAGNYPETMIGMLSMWRAGGVWNPVNIRNALDANVEFMNTVRSRWLLYHSDFTDALDEILARVPSLEHTVCLDRRDGRSPSLEEIGAAGEGRPVPDWGDPFGCADRLMSIFPTGGTTGKSKGVLVTNGNWASLVETAAASFPAAEHPVNLMMSPITHAAGVVALILTSCGATLVVKPGFDAGEALADIERHRVTHLFTPPTAYYALLAHPDLGRYDYSSLRMFLITAAPVAPDRFGEGVKVFGPCLAQMYGQAEVPAIVTWLGPEVVAAAVAGEHPERLASCGRAPLGNQVAIQADDGRLLGPGEVGEIVVRSRLVTLGYFEQPEATAEIRTGGWHHTGDVGYLDGDGYLYIVDRKKDMVITGGFNVFSSEVEAAVLALPGVAECAVIGVPDEKWGEAVKAVVVPRSGAALDEAGIIAAVKEALGSVKAPKSVDIVAALPRTAVGKIDKKPLRAPYWEGHGRLVH